MTPQNSHPSHQAAQVFGHQHTKLFAHEFCEALSGMCGQVFVPSETRSSERTRYDGVVVSMLFTGVFQGEFLVTLSREMTYALLGVDISVDDEEPCDDAVELLKECLNAASQSVMVTFQQAYGEHQLLPAIVVTGSIRYPHYLFFAATLVGTAGEMECTVILNMVESGIARILSQTEKHLMETDILAFTDPLTGAQNRRMFDQMISDMANVGPSEIGHCIALVDVDNFKSVNDRWGHDMGDKALKLVSNALRESSPSRALVCRLGGDEFCVILPDTSDSDSLRHLESALDSIKSTNLFAGSQDSQLDIRITISCGIASLRQGDTPEMWIKNADLAMYRSKDRGRSCVTLLPR